MPKFFWTTCLTAAVITSALAANLLAESATGEAAAESAAAEAAAPEMLTIGSVAPQIDVEHWVQNGEGRFQPITSFKPGEVYVIEFWATWCGPCVSSMPHLSELQQKYADKGVTLVSISDEPLDTVKSFLEREAQGGETDDEGEPLTYADVTKHYCLTTDPDRSVSKDYMEAAKQNGIPTAFIVGKDGHVEWIGHPMNMDEPLEQVVADGWDRDAFAEEFKAEQMFDAALEEVSGLVRQGDFNAARELLAELAANAKPGRMKARVEQAMMSVEVRQFQKTLEDDPAAAATQLTSILEKAEGSAGLIHSVATSLIRHADRGGEVSDEMLQTAEESLVAVIEGEDEPHPILVYTHGQLAYHLGDLDRAIELSQQATDASEGGLKRMLQRHLDKLKSEKEDANEDSDDTESDAAESDEAESDDA